MNKRYQVFVSSTFVDLKAERSKVIQTLMEMDCIPAGMELFPAVDEEQLQFIKRVIDDSDYYLLIIGGRYGSLDPEGISYTEREYDYAVEKGIKVIALVHKDIDSLPAMKTEQSPEGRVRLEKFRKKVMAGRLVKEWNAAEELPGLVALSLQKTIKAHPAVGWVRGSEASSEALLLQIANLQAENMRLRANEEAFKSPVWSGEIELAFAEENLEFIIATDDSMREYILPWKVIFSIVAPRCIEGCDGSSVSKAIISYIRTVRVGNYVRAHVSQMSIDQIKVQFIALGLIDVTALQREGLWRLTPEGIRTLLLTSAVRRGGAADA